MKWLYGENFMKKALLCGLVALGSANLASAEGWYAGAGLGYKQSAYTGHAGFQYTLSNGAWSTSKADFSKGDFLVTLSGGYKFSFSEADVFVALNGTLDHQRAEKKVVSNKSVVPSQDQLSIRRTGNIGIDVGISKNVWDLDWSLKVGAALGRFDLNVSELTAANDSFSSSKKKWALGFAPGFSVEKQVGSGVSVGITYEYQIYQKVKFAAKNSETNNSYSGSGTPKYHVFTLGVKKSF